MCNDQRRETPLKELHDKLEQLLDVTIVGLVGIQFGREKAKILVKILKDLISNT